MPDAWMELCYIDITAQGGSDVGFRALTETIDIDMGEKGFDVITLLNGGQIPKFNPQEPTTITFEAYPLEVGTDTGTTGKGFFDLLHSADTTQPLGIEADMKRNKYRVVLLWTDDPSVTKASDGVALNYKAMRLIFADGYFVSAKPSFTDGILKWTVVFKVTAFDKDGNANIKAESTDGSAELSALNAYTSTVKW